jgi:hypothetical protein
MTRSSIIVRSSAIGTFALLTLVGCQRDDAQQPMRAGEDDTMSGAPAAGSEDTRRTTGATSRTGSDMEGAGTGRSVTGDVSGPTDTQEIQRTGGRDVPMGAGGARAVGGAGGKGGRAGAGGWAGSNMP